MSDSVKAANGELRCVRVEISPDAIESLFKQGYTTGDCRVTCVKGFPQDAKLLYAYWDGWRRLVNLVFEDESFQLVKAGDIIPIFELSYEQVFVSPKTVSTFNSSIESI